MPPTHRASRRINPDSDPRRQLCRNPPSPESIFGPPNAQLSRVITTITALTNQLHVIQERRIAELARNSTSSSTNLASNAGECAICLDILTSPESVITHCGHVFHRDCVMKCPGFRNSSIPCPVCRGEICRVELITVRNGLPQKDLPSESNPVSVYDLSNSSLSEPISVESVQNVSAHGTNTTHNTSIGTNIAESQDNVMNLLSDSDEDDPLLSTSRRRSSLGSDVVEVSCSLQNTQTNTVSSDVQPAAPTLDDELRNLVSLINDSFRSGVMSYHKAKRDMQMEYLGQTKFLEEDYALRRGKLERISVSLVAREQRIVSDELRVRKKLEDVESLERQHNEAIAELNEEKGRLLSSKRLIEQEKTELEATRAGLTNREHELRVKESRVCKVMQLYSERLSALVKKKGNRSTKIDLEPSINDSISGRKRKSSALNSDNSVDGGSSEDSSDDCIVDTVDKAIRADKLKEAKQKTTDSDKSSPVIDPALVLGEQLYRPAPTSRPLMPRSATAKGTGGIVRKPPSLATFTLPRPVVQRPSSAIGKLPTVRR